jgi:hypothetical protein
MEAQARGTNKKVDRMINSALSANFARARRRLLATATMASLALVALPAAASAQEIGATDSQYGATIDLISQGGSPPPSSPSADPGALPFTGLDVALLAAVAGALFLAGVVLRRYRRTELDAG